MADGRGHVAFKGQQVDPQRERKNANRIAKRLGVDQGTAVAFALHMIAENQVLVGEKFSDPDFVRRLETAAKKAGLKREDFILKALKRAVVAQEPAGSNNGNHAGQSSGKSRGNGKTANVTSRAESSTGGRDSHSVQASKRPTRKRNVGQNGATTSPLRSRPAGAWSNG